MRPRELLHQQSIHVKNLSDLQAWATQLAKELQAATLLALEGEVGSGKTQLVQFLARALGAAEPTQSPSFAIHHTYHGKIQIEHLDLYRLESEDDLESTGFWDLFQNRQSVIAIEWADRIPREWLPRDWALWAIHIKLGKESTQREIQFESWS